MNTIRDRFPFFSHNPHVVYLDSAATTLKADVALQALNEYYTSYSVNIHRGMYPLAQKADLAYHASRKKIAHFLNAQTPDEIVFTKGATEGLNLLASSLGQSLINPERGVLTSVIEHHANFVPWQQIAKKHNAPFQVALINPLTMTVREICDEFEKNITQDTAILALTHISNVTGTVLPIQEIAHQARQINPHIIIVLDMCQSVQHMSIDVQQLDIDFAVFSGHKCFGPTGIGVLYGKKSRLDKLLPYQFGGDMIYEVGLSQSSFAEAPSKFEAGTPPIAQAISLASALEFVQELTSSDCHNNLKDLRAYCVKQFEKLFPNDVVVHQSKHLDSCAIVCFTVNRCHPHDVAHMLGEQNICIRAGHHCAQPLHKHLSIPSSCRVSLSVYNTTDDIDSLMQGITRVITQLT